MTTHRAVAEEFTQRVVSTLGEQVESVILYGSVARGDAGPESDIDILVVGDDKRRLNGVAKQIASDLGREGMFTYFISPFEIERDELANLKRLGSPFIRNVLTDGKALYVNEESAGIHNLLGLQDMPTECSPEYIAKQLAKADEALDDARYLLEGGRLQSVANRAYYAMFYAALAALMKSGGELPRTHGGVENQFGLRLRHDRNHRRRPCRHSYRTHTNCAERMTTNCTLLRQTKLNWQSKTPRLSWQKSSESQVSNQYTASSPPAGAAFQGR